MRKRLNEFVQLVIASVDMWTRDAAGHLAAALSFYAMFAAAPLIIIALGLAGMFLGREDVQAFLFVQVSYLAGEEIGETLSQLVTNTPTQQVGLIATIVGVVTLFLTAGGIIHFLRYALNRIWRLIPPPPKDTKGSLVNAVLDQLAATAIILVGGGMLLLSMIGSVLIGLFQDRLVEHFPELASYIPSFNPLLLYAVIFIIFVLTFRLLPTGQIKVRDILPGAFFTLILFAIGEFLIGIYLRFTTFSSVYGTAGSLVAMLVWVNYSAQIFFLGAEFTYLFANKYGSGIKSYPVPDPEPTAPTEPPTPIEPPHQPN